MNYFEGITVRDHNSGTEMRSSYAAIRAKFADVRPPRPKPADLIQGVGSCGHRQPVPDDKALARAIDRLASATQGLAAAISRQDEARQAQAVVEAEVEEPPKKPPPIWKIQNVVARHYKITHNDIISTRRFMNVVLPRQVGMYIAKMDTPRSLPEIGRRFGGRDHTTVLHAVRKIDALIKTDDKLAGEIAEIRAELAEGHASTPFDKSSGAQQQ